MLDNVHYIVIEGPIGVGKTSLAKALAKRLSARLVLEPAADNPFLEKFYLDMPKYALAAQLVFLVSRYQQQTELRRRYLFHSLAVSDYVMAKDRIFAGLTLNEEEFRLYDQLYEVMATRAAKPDVVILLRADVDTLMARIWNRGLPYEAALSREYITRLAAAYDEFFRFYADSPLLVVETSSLDYAKGALREPQAAEGASKSGIDMERLIEEIAQTRSGRRLFVAGQNEEGGRA